MRWDDTQVTPTWSVALVKDGFYNKPDKTKITRPMDGISWMA